MDKQKIIMLLRQYKFYLICLFFFLFLCFCFVFFQKEEEPIITEKEVKKEEPIKEKYIVDIKGAVLNPGTYELSKEQRIKDVVTKAGGFKENANTEYINLSKKIKDEMVIIIYTNEEINEYVEGNKTIKYIDKTCVCPLKQNDGCLEKEKTVTNKKEESSSITGPLNLNTATKEQLESLSGIGSSKALSIIQYREKTPFTKIEDIKNIKGIGDAIFEKIKDNITV